MSSTDSHERAASKLGHYLDVMVQLSASDLHLLAGYRPMLRVFGELSPVQYEPSLEADQVEALVDVLVGLKKGRLLARRELDLSYMHNGCEFRVNIYHQRGTLAVSLRAIRNRIASLAELNLPEALKAVAKWRQGFVLVTGPTGHGKSTTVAALLEELNSARNCHIVTIEDPIEYRIEPVKAVVSQRELETDTLSWRTALRSCLREDPDVVFIGEMRDLTTIRAALTIAETGHLVFSTLHTNSASEAISRIVDVFPVGSRSHIQIQLANVLSMIISQRLVPAVAGGRVPAVEILLNTPAVRMLIRESKMHMIDNVIRTSSQLGMVLLEKALLDLVTRGVITPTSAESWALRPRELVTPQPN